MLAARIDLSSILGRIILENPLLLVFANKRADAIALSTEEIVDLLALREIGWSYWYVQVRFTLHLSKFQI